MNALLRYAQGKFPDTTQPGLHDINCKNFPPACFTNFSDVGHIFLPIVYAIATFLVLYYGIRAAFLYISAEEDAKKLSDARRTIGFSLLGILIIMLSFFISRLVAWMFGIDFLL